MSAETPYPVSDHYDGQKFQNMEPFTDKSFWTVAKWVLTGDREPWPEKLDLTLQPFTSLNGEAGKYRTTFINHATFLVETPEVNFITDPVYSERVSPFSFAGPKRIHPPGVAFDDLPRIDVVLISHNHFDHMDLDTLKKINDKFKPLFIVPLGNKKILEEEKITNIIELDWWQKHDFKSFQIYLTPAQHWSGRGVSDRRKALWGGYWFEDANKKIFFAGDTGYGTFFKKIFEKYKSPDLALLPIGAYHPRWFLKDQHMDPSDAVQAHLDLQSKQSIGIHFGCFRLTGEGPETPAEDLKKAIAEKQILETSFVALKPSENKNF